MIQGEVKKIQAWMTNITEEKDRIASEQNEVSESVKAHVEQLVSSIHERSGGLLAQLEKLSSDKQVHLNQNLAFGSQCLSGLQSLESVPMLFSLACYLVFSSTLLTHRLSRFLSIADNDRLFYIQLCYLLGERHGCRVVSASSPVCSS